MSQLVSLTRSGRVAVITIDNPPVNAIAAGVPEGMAAALESAQADPEVDAIVLIGAGKTFIAGADLAEFARTKQGPNLHNLLASLEDSPKPTVVAVHGTALGGGVETAMAANYRVAAPDAQLGMPEVTIGVVPGAEGTQRLPRLVGVAKAVDMMMTAAPVKAPEALKLGLIDRVIEGDLLAGAVAFAQEMAAKGGPHPKTRERNEKLGTPETNASIFAAGREQARKIRRNQTAPLAVLEALEAATTLPFVEGCKKERELSDASLRSPQAQALIHAFFAERAVAKVADVPKDTPVFPIRKAAIVGAGTMGGGIAMALANAGIPVRVTDSSQAALDRGMATVRKNYESSVKRGRLTPEVMEQRIALIQPQTGYAGFEEADIIIEAVYESMDLKKQIFGEIDKIARRDCVLATNTSTLDIDEIAGATPRPEMVIGLHFFSPAHVMRLLEIVRGKQTGKPVVATVLALAKTLRKVGVLVGNGYGFVGNRMMFQYMREAQLLVEEGATPAQVDGALTEWGMAMGIFAVDDMGGLDLGARVFADIRKMQAASMSPAPRMPVMLDKLVAMGRLGQKTGAGWFRYDETRKPIPDPEVEALIEQTAREAGIPRRTITKDEIIERCVYSMINEGAKILEEGRAQRASDIDTIYMTGYGFPAYRGGPMWYADEVGLGKILARVKEFHRQHGELWKPAPLLEWLVAEGKTFASLDAAKEQGVAA
jgi:3-hydroxyacyl-CoA dehydrogenase